MYRLTTLAFVALTMPLFAQGQHEGVIKIDPSMGAPNPTAPAGQVSNNNNLVPNTHAIILPAAQATSFGNANNVIPFTWTPSHYMQVFHASDVKAGSHLMFSLGLRQDNAFSGFTGAIADIEIWLGYTKKNRTTLLTTYASNWDSGTPVNVLPRTSICIPDMPSTRPTNPHVFFFQIFFRVPFSYDPSKGNLLIEIKQHGHSKGNRIFTFPLDAQSGSATTSRIFSSNNSNATVGSKSTGFGLIMEFGSKPGKNCNRVLASTTPFGRGCPGTGGHSGHIVPVVARTRFLNTANAWTFGSGPQRWQQQINGSQMPKVPTQFLFMAERDDSVARTAAANTMTFKIEFGNTARTSSTMTSNYASNRTSTMKVVFSGNVNLPAVSGGNSDINKFIYLVPFKAPYLYIPDARNANFLIDISNTTARRVARFPDAESGAAAQGTRVYANGNPTALTGILNKNHCMAICFGTKGVGNATPVHTATGRPIINKSFSLDLAAARPSSGAALIIGGSNTKWGIINLPLSLAGLGAKGCFLYVSVDLILSIPTSATGSASIALTVPNNPALIGLSIFSQYLVLDPPANAGGLVTTNGLTLKFGDA